MGRKHLTSQEIEEFREAACRIALSLYATHQDVTLRQLAAAMKCSPATPYRYFDHKEALFMAVRADCFVRFGDHLEESLSPISHALERLRALCHLYARYAHDFPTEFRLMFSLGQPDYDTYPWAQQAAQRGWQIVETTAHAAIDEGFLIGDPHTIAHLFWSSVHGVVMLSLSERLRMGFDHTTLIPPLVDALVRAHAPSTTTGFSS